MNNKSIPVKLMRPGQVGVITESKLKDLVGLIVLVERKNIIIVRKDGTDTWIDYKELDDLFMVRIIEPLEPTPKPIEIKVNGCESCPFWQFDLYGIHTAAIQQICTMGIILMSSSNTVL